MKTSNFKTQTTNNTKNQSKTQFDLENRMSKFGKEIVIFCRNLVVDHISRIIVNQLVRSATSIGANYAEANNSSSRKDFRNKVHIAKKEVQKTKHWLLMLKPCFPQYDEKIELFRQEAHELTLILQSIVNKLNNKDEV